MHVLLAGPLAKEGGGFSEESSLPQVVTCTPKKN